MRQYRDVWLTVTAVVLLCGVWVAAADYTVLTSLTIFFFTSVPAGCVLFTMYDDERPRCGRLRLVAESVLIGLAVVAASGMFALLGAAAWLPILGSLAASPWAVRRALRVYRRRTTADKSVHDEPPIHPVPAALTEPSRLSSRL